VSTEGDTTQKVEVIPTKLPEPGLDIGTSNGYQMYLYKVHIGKFINDLSGMIYKISTTGLPGSAHPGM